MREAGCLRSTTPGLSSACHKCVGLLSLLSKLQAVSTRRWPSNQPLTTTHSATYNHLQPPTQPLTTTHSAIHNHPLSHSQPPTQPFTTTHSPNQPLITTQPLKNTQSATHNHPLSHSQPPNQPLPTTHSTPQNHPLGHAISHIEVSTRVTDRYRGIWRVRGGSSH